jgi:hypothetical protein
MDTVLTDKIVRAKKNYPCDASSAWLRSNYCVDDCETITQRLSVEAAEADKWKIFKGQQYRKVTGIHDGEFCTYKARIDMDAVCNALDMFDE